LCIPLSRTSGGLLRLLLPPHLLLLLTRHLPVLPPFPRGGGPPQALQPRVFHSAPRLLRTRPVRSRLLHLRRPPQPARKHLVPVRAIPAPPARAAASARNPAPRGARPRRARVARGCGGVARARAHGEHESARKAVLGLAAPRRLRAPRRHLLPRRRSGGPVHHAAARPVRRRGLVSAPHARRRARSRVCKVTHSVCRSQALALPRRPRVRSGAYGAASALLGAAPRPERVFFGIDVRAVAAAPRRETRLRAPRHRGTVGRVVGPSGRWALGAARRGAGT
jgi:hypothetical protein